MNKPSTLLSNPLVAVPLAILCTTLWGSAFVAVKSGYELFGVGADDTAAKVMFAGMRFTLAGLLVLLLNLFIGGGKTQKISSLTKRMWAQIALLGVSQTTIHYYFFYVGVSYTTAAKSSILNSVSVFFSAVLAHLFYSDDKLTLKKGAGVLIGFAAVVLVNFEPKIGLQMALRGEGFIVISSLVNSVALLYSKRISSWITPVILTGFQLTIGGVVLLVSAVVMGAPILGSTVGGWVLLLYLALISSVAFTIWAALLKHNKMSSITVFNFLIPVVGTLLSTVVLKEKIFQFSLLIALAAVAIGIALVQSPTKNRL